MFTEQGITTHEHNHGTRPGILFSCLCITSQGPEGKHGGRRHHDRDPDDSDDDSEVSNHYQVNVSHRRNGKLDDGRVTRRTRSS